MNEHVTTGIGPEFIKTIFKGRPFSSSVVELIKNPRDWKASVVMIFTDNKGTFRFIDDGIGMDGKNRAASLSVGMTTGIELNQSSKFGSGMKHFFFAFSQKMIVTTVSAETPELVHQYEVSVDELNDSLRSQGTIPITVAPKTEQSWPHPFPTGTDITFILENPSTRRILRGSRLRKELASKLPIWFQKIVIVDGEALPDKEVYGDHFRMDKQHDQLGKVGLELYRPKRLKDEDGVLLAGHEIGEANIRSLERLLKTTPLSIPEVFLSGEVCGTITCELFQRYANEDRTTLNHSIVDDPRIGPFIAFLEEFDEAVQHRLGVTLGTKVSDDSDMDIVQVVQRFNKRYQDETSRPDSVPVEPNDLHGGTEDEDSSNQGGGSKKASLLRLTVPRREFALSEIFKVKLHLSKALETHAGRLVWNTGNCKGSIEEINTDETEYVLIADQIGRASVMVEILGTEHKAEVTYTVVDTRRFGLVRSSHTVSVGTELIIRTKNADCLTGKSEWNLRGDGELTANPNNSATFVANRVGKVTVSVLDSKDPEQISHCDIHVTPANDTQLICIRGYWFKCSPWQTTGNIGHNKPITMMYGGDQHGVHRLNINLSAPGISWAKEQGTQQQFLLQAIAEEFARFSVTTLNQVDDLDLLDISGFLNDLAEDSYKIIEEITS